MTSLDNIVALSVVARVSAVPPRLSPVPVVQSSLFPESVLDEVTRIVAPLQVTYSDDYAIRAEGTEEQARAALLLQGYGLPGDTKLGQRHFVFKTKNGRKVNVQRRKGKNGSFIEVHVRKTPEEELAILQHGIEVRERMKLEGEEKAKHQHCPERYRNVVGTWIELVRQAVLQGNAVVLTGGFASRRLSSEDTAAAIALIDQLDKVVSSAKIIRSGLDVGPSLSLV